MTDDEAVARMRARWSHPPLDRRDVEERIAIRFLDGPAPDVVVLGPHPNACRLFVRLRHDGTYASRYVHTVADVDATLDRLLEVA